MTDGTAAENPLWIADRPLVLASRSPARRDLLSRAGIPVRAMAADIDERTIETALRAQNAHPDAVALCLAEAKALRISERLPGDHVLGADQVLACDGEIFAKPSGHAQAAAQLAALSGRTHCLYSAACVARGGRVLFQAVSMASLTMRVLTQPFIDAYLRGAGAVILDCVGAYQAEALGVNLFSHIVGDHPTILGLPLLSLLEFLRGQGLLLA
jgi:septum formation protein